MERAQGRLEEPCAVWVLRRVHVALWRGWVAGWVWRWAVMREQPSQGCTRTHVVSTAWRGEGWGPAPGGGYRDVHTGAGLAPQGKAGPHTGGEVGSRTV